MAKFNQAVGSGAALPQPDTKNMAGGQAFTLTPKLELTLLVLTSFLKDKFYESEAAQATRIRELVAKVNDMEFVAKLAVYARDKFHMRSVSHLLAYHVSAGAKGKTWTKRFYEKVVMRPDDITEILAAHSGITNKGPIPNSMKKGLAKAFDKFDRYSLGKYRGEGKDISLRVAVKLTHPKPTERNADALRDLINGTLRSEDTWETKLTQAGQTGTTEEEVAENKEEAWRDLVLNGKIKYFALLRNMRNIMEQGDQATIDKAIELLVDEKAIKNSRVLPFRFLTASKVIDGSTPNGRRVLDAIDQAVTISLQNVPQFEGRTLVALDSSGSMSGVAEIGSLFTAVLAKAMNADVMLWDTSVQHVSYTLAESTLNLAKRLRAAMHGGGTNMHIVFEEARAKYDRIVILSDQQNWVRNAPAVDSFNAYKTAYKADPMVYHFDLQGYGTLQFPENRVFCLAGFSEHTMTVMQNLETNRDALIQEIEAIAL